MDVKNSLIAGYQFCGDRSTDMMVFLMNVMAEAHKELALDGVSFTVGHITI